MAAHFQPLGGWRSILCVALLGAVPAQAKDEAGSAPATGAAKVPVNERREFIDPATPKNVQPAGPKGHWTLTFSDEFQAGKLNEAKWKAHDELRSILGHANHGVRWGWDPANVSVAAKAGNLVIATTNNGDEGFRSGAVDTRGRFEQRYGFFEAHIKAPPKNNGHQAAFWLASTENAFEKSGAEVDVVETHLASDEATSTLHWNGYKPGQQQVVSKTWPAPGLHEGFHTYGVEWTPNKLRFYYDGKLVWKHEGRGVPQVEEFIICSVGILDWVKGDIREAHLPQQTYFDWVRAYAAEPERGR